MTALNAAGETLKLFIVGALIDMERLGRLEQAKVIANHYPDVVVFC